VSNISYYTTIAGALAAATAISGSRTKVMQVTPLQAYA
jgi:hypothetical protein